MCLTLAKAYASHHDIEKAMMYAKISATLNKGYLNSFILIALLYSAKKEYHKSQLLIDRLLQDNPQNPLLHVLKAYLETEKWLHKTHKNENF